MSIFAGERSASQLHLLMQKYASHIKLYMLQKSGDGTLSEYRFGVFLQIFVQLFFLKKL